MKAILMVTQKELSLSFDFPTKASIRGMGCVLHMVTVLSGLLNLVSLNTRIFPKKSFNYETNTSRLP